MTDSPPQSTSSSGDQSNENRSDGYRLLIVEDNRVTLRLLQMIFEGEAHRVDTARTVDEALFKAEDNDYDAFVLDINLSERRTGIEVLHAIRRMPRHDRAPAIACTAYALHDHQALFREAGFTDVIPKPITKQKLLGGIEAAIETPSPTLPSAGPSHDGADLPPLPTTIPRVLELIARNGQKETDYERLISVVRLDQALSTGLIQQANSAFFKLSTNIDSIEDAIQYMGFRPVCNLLLGKLLTQRFSHFDTEGERQVYEHIMHRGLGAAYLARALAERVDLTHPEIAYSAVLLTQLGRLLLLDDRRGEYVGLWFDEDNGDFLGPPPLGREALFLSTNYVMAGVAVGQRHKFSGRLLSVMRHHRQPSAVFDEDQKLLTAVVATGLETYAAMMGRPSGELLSVLLESHPLELTVELTGVDRRALMSDVRKMFAEARAFADEVLAGEVLAGEVAAAHSGEDSA